MSKSRSSTNTNNTESKQDSNTPFSALPQEIQEYLVFKDILEKNWDSYSREVQQKILNEFALQKTANQAQAIEQKPAANTSNKTEIPIDTWDLIGEFLGVKPEAGATQKYPFHEAADVKALASLSRASKASYSLFQPTMNKAKKAKLKELLEAILCPEVDAERKIDRIADIKKVIEKYPHLLLEELDEKECMEIRGPSGHPAAPTLYRTALATEDTQLAKMIKAKLIKVGGEKAANDQYNAQFPEGWEAKEEERWAPIFKQLKVMTEAIRYATHHDIVSSGHSNHNLTVRDGSYVAIELATFRSMLDATLNDAATAGRHFNPNFLLKAFQLYDDHYQDYFGNNWDDPRAMAFWQLVIGYVERFLPVNYIQAFFDRLCMSEDKLRKGEPQARSLKFEVFDEGRNSWGPVDFYPLSTSRLGFNFAIYADSFLRDIRTPLGLEWGLGRTFSKLMSIKNSKCRELTPHRSHSKSGTMSCSVM